MPLRCFLHVLRQVWELVLVARRLSNLQQNCLFLHLHQDYQSPTSLSEEAVTLHTQRLQRARKNNSSVWSGSSMICPLLPRGSQLCLQCLQVSSSPGHKNPSFICNWVPQSGFSIRRTCFEVNFHWATYYASFGIWKTEEKNPVTDQKLSMSKYYGNTDSSRGFTRFIVSLMLDKPERNSLGTII